MKDKITRNTAISGKPVKKGDIVDMDESTFKVLKSYNRAITCDAVPERQGPPTKARKPAVKKEK